MTDIPPMLFDWTDDGVLRPISPKRADQHYVVGERYRMAPYEERSLASHNHYFAAVTEAWRNLPEDIADDFPTAEHLRKYALIKTGYRDSRSVACASKAEAQRVAAFVKPLDEYAIVTVHEALVTVYTAQSQSMRAMGKQRFEESKSAVLDLLAGMVKTERATLEANAGQAA